MNPSRRRPTCRVYIGGLASDTRVSDIEKFFKNYARRIDILLKRGFAFIVSKSELNSINIFKYIINYKLIKFPRFHYSNILVNVPINFTHSANFNILGI